MRTSVDTTLVAPVTVGAVFTSSTSIATVRSDGAPRISGIEAAFEDGELAFGSMLVEGTPGEVQSDHRVIEAYIGGDDEDEESA